MGMSTGGAASGGSRRRRSRRRQPMSEINVTPMVDVMLVLLIIFMVAAPMLTVGVPLELPKTAAKALNAETQPISVSVRGDGIVFIQETEIAEADVVTKLTEIAKTGYQERIFVRAATSVDYGSVIRVMALISAAGFTNIGLVTDTETTS
jgi:biopolymer transport protein TolR